MADASPPLDARKVRAEQAVVAIALLAGFVFRAAWVIPAVTVVEALGVAAWRANLVHRAWDGTLAARLGAATQLEDPELARLGSLLGVAVLTVATVALVGAVVGLAWLIALVVAVVDAVAATTRVDPVRTLLVRLRRRV